MDALSKRHRMIERTAERLEELIKQAPNQAGAMSEAISLLERAGLLESPVRTKDGMQAFLMDAITENVTLTDQVGPMLEDSHNPPTQAQSIAELVSLLQGGDNHLD